LEWEIIAAKMGRGGRHPHCSEKFSVPLFSVALCACWGETEGGELVVILAGGGGNGRTGVPNSLLLARYDFSRFALSRAFHDFSTGCDPPYRLAMHPGGRVFVCSLENGCRLFTLKKAADNPNPGIFPSERQIEFLQSAGEQNSLVFSADGTRFAAGGDDGHLRVVEWPSHKVSIERSRRQQADVCVGFFYQQKRFRVLLSLVSFLYG
jgi:prolactin regulatory element-binding protein